MTRVMEIIKWWMVILLYSLSICWTEVRTEKIKNNKIYSNIESKYYCFRRLNATHQFGCQSRGDGNVGVLDWISNITDIKWVVAEGPHNPYIPVLHIRDFKNILINQLVDSKRITGIIVIQPSEEPLNSGFSPETSCPNDGVNYYNDNRFRNESFGHCSAQKWNPQNPAMDLLFRNFDFPILLVTRKQDIDNIKKCIKKYGRSDENPEPIWPLCSAQIFTRMRAAKDSVTCMRRNTFVNPLDTPLRYCDPLQSFNVFSPLFTINSKSTISNSSLIVLAARMDALTFFYDKVPGADSPVTGLVVLLSVIETLSRVMSELQRERKGDSNVLFAIFNGEAYDYIGSGRMAYDLTNSQFNPKSKSEYSLNLPSFNFQELAYFIELNQLAAYSGAQELWMHADPISLRDSTVKKKVDDLVQTFKLHQQKLAVNLVDNVALPPSSFQMFLREQPNLAGLVLTNHKGIYANRYYHSIMDNYLNIKANVSESTSNTEENTNELVQHLVSMSTLVSKSVYQMITTKSDLNITANATTINNLLYCFLKNITCSHFLRFFSPDDAEIVKKNLRDVPTVPMYVGGYIQTKSPAWWLREFITLEIADYLGKKSKNVSFGECFTRKESKNSSSFDWYKLADSENGTCYESQVFLSDALSPVFLTEPPRWNLNYSTWTESFWDTPYARIFLQAGRVQEGLTLLAGLFVTIFSFLIVQILKNYNSVIFRINSDFSGTNLISNSNPTC